MRLCRSADLYSMSSEITLCMAVCNVRPGQNSKVQLEYGVLCMCQPDLNTAITVAIIQCQA